MRWRRGAASGGTASGFDGVHGAAWARFVCSCVFDVRRASESRPGLACIPSVAARGGMRRAVIRTCSTSAPCINRCKPGLCSCVVKCARARPCLSKSSALDSSQMRVVGPCYFHIGRHAMEILGNSMSPIAQRLFSACGARMSWIERVQFP